MFQSKNYPIQTAPPHKHKIRNNCFNPKIIRFKLLLPINIKFGIIVSIQKLSDSNGRGGGASISGDVTFQSKNYPIQTVDAIDNGLG